MKQIINQNDIKQLGTILGVWAHPDDETFCAAGIMAAAVNNNQKVICITATRGENGTQDPSKWPEESLGQIRSQELKAALKIIGVKNHYWLEYRDGDCSTVDVLSAAKKIANYIELHSPDTIITFGPEGLTGHPDHMAVSKWVDSAVSLTNTQINVYHAVITKNQHDRYLRTADDKLNFFFNIDQPPIEIDQDCDICFCCNDELCECKHQAFSAMPSQMEALHNQFDKEYLKAAFRVEAFKLKERTEKD